MGNLNISFFYRDIPAGKSLDMLRGRILPLPYQAYQLVHYEFKSLKTIAVCTFKAVKLLSYRA